MLRVSSVTSDESPAYEGLKVVDLSQGVAGPHCGMLFALHGADVIKVEPPDGDWGRAIGKRHGDFSAYGVAFNRGKRSLALDLRRPEGREVVARLVAGADVVVETVCSPVRSQIAV
jgi:crotonobetainyl-CoA:carnitine CoA-transferase CaiB-like acyl-CoA transferase